MYLVLLMFFPAAAFIIFSLRLARLVVRSRISSLTMFLCNLVSFSLIWGCIQVFFRNYTLLCIFGYGICAILAASVFLLLKRKKHDPNKITVADLEVCPYSPALRQHQLDDLRSKVSVRRELYNGWFKTYFFQIVILMGLFYLFSAFI